MTFLVPMMIAVSLLQSTYPTPGPGRNSYTGSSCTPPTLTYDWTAASFTGAARCGTAGTTLCTNGAVAKTWAEPLASNIATGTVITGTLPVYETAQVNGKPAIEWTSGVGSYFLISTPIPTTLNTFTFFATLAPVTGATRKILGGGSAGAVRWYISSTGHQVVEGSSGVSITGTTALTSGVYKTIKFTYSTTSVNLYVCSGGTCSSDGSGITSVPITAINVLGQEQGTFFLGHIAEIGFLNSVDTTNDIGVYALCQYGT